MEPKSWFLKIYKRVSLLKFPNEAGMTPIRLFAVKSSLVIELSDNALKCVLVIYLCGRYFLITMLNLYN